MIKIKIQQVPGKVPRAAVLRRVRHLVQVAVLVRAEQDQDPEQAAVLPVRNPVNLAEAAPGEADRKRTVYSSSGLNRCAHNLPGLTASRYDPYCVGGSRNLVEDDVFLLSRPHEHG
jgi:hypothetical protein